MKHHRNVSRTYACSACPQTFSRKRDGRKHIYFDFENCNGLSYKRGRKKIYVKQEIVERSNCPFCNQEIAESRNVLMQHLGRHLEEISFAVVSRPYEEWQFYEDSVSAKSSVPSVVLNQSIGDAVTSGNYQLCEALLSAGANVNSKKSGMTLLHIACSRGDYAITWLLLRKGADHMLGLRKADHTYETPLDVACYNGYTDIVSLLSKTVEDPESIQRAMLLAVDAGRASIFKDLVLAYQGRQKFSNSSVLERAVQARQLEIVQFLVGNGAKLTAQDNRETNPLLASLRTRDKTMVLTVLGASEIITPCCWRTAGAMGSKEIILAFIARASLLGGPDEPKAALSLNPCLIGAAKKNHVEIVEFLLDSGANFEQETVDHACEQGKTEVVYLLLRKGGRAQSSHITAASYGGYTAIVRHLVDFGAVPTLDALTTTIDRGHGDTFKYLVTAFPHILVQQHENLEDHEFMMRAYVGGSKIIVQHLMAVGISLPLVPANMSQWRDTELHRAASRGHHEIVQLLLEQGFDPNLKGLYDENALHRACEMGHRKVVEVLLDAGANPNGTNGSRLRNPLAYTNSTKIKNILRKHGATG
ncbi:ankyrin [Pyrenochaeta sp. DS3sAY3a]|nr:ankyrin [Pyrenochaeta sp. DS3sAY3a]